MKRSEINIEIKNALELLKKHKVYLPELCTYLPEEWAKKGQEYNEIRDNKLGWDITDFGLGDFNKIGLLLITLRNGNTYMKDKYSKPYAEKYMVVKERQITPMHFHWFKMEDIINRGGGNLIVKIYNSTKEEIIEKTDVVVCIDGVKKTYPAGYELRLEPGQSITIEPGLYHSFWGEPGKGEVLVGEVSMTNDDDKDNRFYENVGRFPDIEEDEAPFRLLCNEYPSLVTK